MRTAAWRVAVAVAALLFVACCLALPPKGAGGAPGYTHEAPGLAAGGKQQQAGGVEHRQRALMEQRRQQRLGARLGGKPREAGEGLVTGTPRGRSGLMDTRDASNLSAVCIDPTTGDYPPVGSCSTIYDAVPAIIEIGVYFTEISNIDSFSNTFQAQGYCWFKWHTCQVIGDVLYRPDQTMVMENTAEVVSDPIPEVGCPDDPDVGCALCDIPRAGWSYYNFKFNNQFFMKFGYNHYPLDSQSLFVSFEDIYYSADSVQIKFDVSSAISNSMSAPGYKVSSSTWNNTYNNEMLTDYGLGESNAVYSHCNIGLKLERNSAFFILKILPPAAITLGVSIIVTFLDPLEIQGRLGVAVSGLLSMVFLSTGTASKIPDIGQVTIADWVYNWYFFMLLLIVIETITVHRWLRRFGNVLLFKALEEAVSTKKPEASSTPAIPASPRIPTSPLATSTSTSTSTPNPSPSASPAPAPSPSLPFNLLLNPAAGTNAGAGSRSSTPTPPITTPLTAPGPADSPAPHRHRHHHHKHRSSDAADDKDSDSNDGGGGVGSKTKNKKKDKDKDKDNKPTLPESDPSGDDNDSDKNSTPRSSSSTTTTTVVDSPTASAHRSTNTSPPSTTATTSPHSPLSQAPSVNPLRSSFGFGLGLKNSSPLRTSSSPLTASSVTPTLRSARSAISTHISELAKSGVTKFAGKAKGLDVTDANEMFQKRLMKAKLFDKATALFISVIAVLGTIFISLLGKYG
ncbi:hypothetical protein Pelo_10159 [Pelomyxa schiedti]|nr:hypothetical protein Pelo_10159 [Pelomyxa schiedti]